MIIVAFDFDFLDAVFCRGDFQFVVAYDEDEAFDFVFGLCEEAGFGFRLAFFLRDTGRYVLYGTFQTSYDFIVALQRQQIFYYAHFYNSGWVGITAKPKF